MHKYFWIIILISALSLSAQSLKPAEIIAKIDATEKVASSESMAKQIITTSSGKIRTLEMKMFTKNKNEKQLSIYTKPARVKGDKILMLNEGDDIYFYTPKTDRVRHLASHAKRKKVQGSDFSYEDMAGGNLADDYTNKFLGFEKIRERECYKFECRPTESGPHYKKLILWADKERFITLQVDYYEEENDILKRLSCEDIRLIDGHWYPLKLTMKNLQEGGQTIIKTMEIKFDLELSDRIFTTNNLKKR